MNSKYSDPECDDCDQVTWQARRADKDYNRIHDQITHEYEQKLKQVKDEAQYKLRMAELEHEKKISGAQQQYTEHL